MSVKLSSSLPADDRDGMGPLAAAMVNDPERMHVIIAIVDCAKITTNVDTGDQVPTARIRAVEAFLGHTADAKEVRRLWRRAYDRRTGRVELPLEIERELDRLGGSDAVEGDVD